MTITAPATEHFSGEPEGKIAYVSFTKGDQEIYIMNADGSDQHDLTNDPHQDFDPDITADGQRITFVSNRAGQTQVYVMDREGADVRQLTADSAGGVNPRWSRDGTKIAYTRGALDLAVMNADGSDIHVIMHGEPEKTAAPCRAGAFPGNWSPDDQVITYYSASISRQIGQVCTIRADGSDMKVVVADDKVYDTEPVFSPDGTKIAYRAIINGQHDIWAVDLASGQRTNLTHDADLDIEPDWSPDGNWIAFGSLRPGAPHFNLFIMRPDGSDVRQLTTDPAKESNPVWGP